MEENLNISVWEEGEVTAYGFKVEEGVLSGNGGAWPIKNIGSIQCKEAEKSGFWESIGWGSAICVSVLIEGKEFIILRIEHGLFEGIDVWFEKWQKCNEVVDLVKHFMK